jgi:hypothetical protein
VSAAGDLFAPVLEALAADPGTEFGQPGATVEVLRQVDGPFSSVQQVRIHTPHRTVHAYTKVLKPRKPGPDELAMLDRMLLREYNATAALYRALPPDPEIGAVRPIAILPEHRALATEEVPGRPFAALLADNKSVSGQELVAIARRIGMWARLYQQLVPAEGTVVLAERRTYLDQRLQLLEGRVLTAAERAASLDLFDALCREIGSGEVPAAPIHADLGPTNIIVDAAGRIAVLDFTMAKTGTVHHDLSHVYFHLELLAARNRRRRAQMASLQRAVLDGYRPGLTAADPLFRLMLLQHVVCHVALLAERRVPFVDAAYRWYLRRRWQLCERIAAVTPEIQAA